MSFFTLESVDDVTLQVLLLGKISGIRPFGRDGGSHIVTEASQLPSASSWQDMRLGPDFSRLAVGMCTWAMWHNAPHRVWGQRLRVETVSDAPFRVGKSRTIVGS